MKAVVLKYRRLPGIIIQTVLLMLTLFGYIIISGLSSDKPFDLKPDILPEDLVDAITVSVDNPSEDEIFDFDRVDNDPYKINIPSIETSGFILKVGIDQFNQIAVPNNIHLSGWYINSVRPGEQGLSIIAGHLDGRTRGGIFKNLESIEVDDTFALEYGNGEVINFKVVDVVKVSLENAYDVLFAKRENIDAQLNLITCLGVYLQDQRTYDSRLVVVSERL